MYGMGLNLPTSIIFLLFWLLPYAPMFTDTYRFLCKCYEFIVCADVALWKKQLKHGELYTIILFQNVLVIKTFLTLIKKCTDSKIRDNTLSVSSGLVRISH